MSTFSFTKAPFHKLFAHRHAPSSLKSTFPISKIPFSRGFCAPACPILVDVGVFNFKNFVFVCILLTDMPHPHCSRRFRFHKHRFREVFAHRHAPSSLMSTSPLSTTPFGEVFVHRHAPSFLTSAFSRPKAPLSRGICPLTGHILVDRRFRFQTLRFLGAIWVVFWGSSGVSPGAPLGCPLGRLWVSSGYPLGCSLELFWGSLWRSSGVPSDALLRAVL